MCLGVVAWCASCVPVGWADFDLTDNSNSARIPVFPQAASRNGPRGPAAADSRIHLPNTVILLESPVVEGHRIRVRRLIWQDQSSQRSCRVPIPYLAGYLGLQTYRMLVGVTRSALKQEAHSPTRLPARKHGRWLNAASRRAMRATSLHSLPHAPATDWTKK